MRFMSGWVKVHRIIQNNWIWEDKPFSRGQAFVDLIMMMNYEDKKLMFNGTLIEVKRGSTITSIRKLSEKWGWSKGKVDHFLKQLQNDKTITYKKDSKKTVVTLENYDLYQNQDLKNGHQKDSELTLNDNRMESRWNQNDTNKNNKEYIKNNKEEEEGGESSNPQPLSFPSPLYKKIFDKWGDIAYRTWFSDTSITETNNVITMNVPDNFRKRIIKEKYLDYMTMLAGKQVIIS